MNSLGSHPWHWFTHTSRFHDGLDSFLAMHRIEISIDIFSPSSPSLVIYPNIHVGGHPHDNVDEDTCDAHASNPRSDRKRGWNGDILEIRRRWRPNDVHARVRDTPVDEGVGSKDTYVDEPSPPQVDEPSSTRMQDTCTGAIRNVPMPRGRSMHRKVQEKAKE